MKKNKIKIVGGWGVEYLYYYFNYLGEKMVFVVYFFCRFFFVCLLMNF